MIHYDKPRLRLLAMRRSEQGKSGHLTLIANSVNEGWLPQRMQFEDADRVSKLLGL